MFRVVIAVAMALVVLAAAFVWWFPSFVMTGKRQTLEEAMQWQSEHYDTSFYQELERQDYVVEGYDGYLLHAELLLNPQPTDRYVILSHGYTDNRLGSLKYVPMYLARGHNCIVYDLRGHGENEPTFTTYGILEGRDLACLVKDTRERYRNLTQLGLHGESLGAASTISSLKWHPDVDFVVADCGFSDIENVLREAYRNAHVPEALFDVASFGSSLRYHYALKDMRPIDSLAENDVPILFVHGADDDFIPPRNSEDMAKATRGYSEVHIVAGAGHAESILVEPDAYGGYVTAFLERCS